MRWEKNELPYLIIFATEPDVQAITCSNVLDYTD